MVLELVNTWLKKLRTFLTSANQTSHNIREGNGAADWLVRGISHWYDDNNPTLSSVAGKWSIKISNSITLKSILNVPNLSCNLLSIGKLTKDSTCSAKFFPSRCVFKDLSSGRRLTVLQNVRGCTTLRRLIGVNSVKLQFVSLHLSLEIVKFCYGIIDKAIPISNI